MAGRKSPQPTPTVPHRPGSTSRSTQPGAPRGAGASFPRHSAPQQPAGAPAPPERSWPPATGPGQPSPGTNGATPRRTADALDVPSTRTGTPTAGDIMRPAPGEGGPVTVLQPPVRPVTAMTGPQVPLKP